MPSALRFLPGLALLVLAGANARAHSAVYIPPPPVPEPYTGPVGGSGGLNPVPGVPSGQTGGGGGGGGGGGAAGGAEPGRRPRGEPGSGPGGGPGAPTRPGGAAGATGGRAGGGTTPGRKKGGGSASTPEWNHWWALNDDRFLLHRRLLRRRAAASDNHDTFLDLEAPAGSPAAATTAEIRKEILPALLSGLKDPFSDARAGAVIALGKAADSGDSDVLGHIRCLLADSDRIVRESAGLGLGLLGNPSAVPDLLDIAADTPRGRELAGAGGGEIPARLRCFAAVAIGMIGARMPPGSSRGILERLGEIARTRTAHVDVQVGAVLAFQLAGDTLAAPALLGIFTDPSQDRLVRAHAAIALGKIGARAAIPALAAGLQDRSIVVQQASATALGLLASREDRDLVARLIRFATRAPDRSARNLCLIALGEIGHPEGKALLVRNVRKGAYDDATFSALALGVLGHKFPEERAEIGAVLLEAFPGAQEAGKPAMALGLGLAGCLPAGDVLRTELSGEGHQETKGHVAVALGLLGDRAAIPRIRELLAQSADPDLRQRAAVALGLLGDQDAIGILHAAIRESSASKSTLGAATVALGLIGDRSAIPVLRDMLEDQGRVHQDLTRAFAAVALGFLGDKDERPLLSRLHESAAYTASTEAFAELLSIL